MPVIICNIQMFDNAQSIYLVQEGHDSELLATVPNKELGDTITTFCKTFNINNVCLYGVTEYADYYADEVKKSEISNYSTSNINVQVN